MACFTAFKECLPKQIRQQKLDVMQNLYVPLISKIFRRCLFLKNYVPISHDQQNFNILSNSEVACNVSLNSKLSLVMAKTYISEIPGKLKAP